MLSSYYLNGRCYCHCNVADVFTTTVYCNSCIGWCYCQVADGIATCYCLFLLFFGQMLLPCGRWNSHYFVFVCDGRCYCPVADGMATAGCECFPPGRCCSQGADGLWVVYLSFSSEVLCRTSSHIWGRWYLPMFLFRDGLFTLMYNASLIHLQRFWSSLPTMLNFLW